MPMSAVAQTVMQASYEILVYNLLKTNACFSNKKIGCIPEECSLLLTSGLGELGLPSGLPEERENALALLVGNAQGLDTQLLLNLQCLQLG